MDWDGYATRWAALHGGFDPRGASPVVRGWVRTAYRIGSSLGRRGVSPTAVTLAGLVLCVGVPIAASQGAPGLLVGALLVLLAGVADSVDGAVAVATGKATKLGYVHDSVADRLGEVCWLAAFWVAGVLPPLAVAAGGLSWLHEYVRARAIPAGMTGVGAVTVGERPTRVIVTLVALVAGGVAGLVDDDLTVPVLTALLALWVLLALVGFVQLWTAVHRALR